ncbi:MAG TPA: hypothetical protein VJJ54_06920 [Gemmatimonadales bacterium]|nr:hypothetical protein [Gemmatimonadales bacterium]
MRVYALLLGIALTSGYGYAAQLAVSSLDTGRQTRRDAATPVPASGAPDAVWYGGVLDPVTVESSSGDTRAAAAQGRVFSRPAVRCVGADRSTFRTIS